MKILFTGASSFTGTWFVHELVKAGHEVTAIYRRPLGSYTDNRRKRVERLQGLCEQIPGVSFGDDAFLDLINGASHWDLLCHHGADVTNYKSPDFDAVRALERNSHNLSMVLAKLKERSCNRVLLTGSVFEPNEGKGPDSHRAFSPYGLSKGLTYQTFAYYTEHHEMKLGKFVIPNPFGPLEEFRFTSFLAKSWFQGQTPTVTQPSYVRDNIHVTLLSKAYAMFAATLTSEAGLQVHSPSGYADEQGAFTALFAEKMRERLDLPCDFVLGEQTEFPEPKSRVNREPLDGALLRWDEEAAWDELAEFYREAFGAMAKVQQS